MSKGRYFLGMSHQMRDIWTMVMAVSMGLGMWGETGSVFFAALTFIFVEVMDRLHLWLLDQGY